VARLWGGTSRWPSFHPTHPPTPNASQLICVFPYAGLQWAAVVVSAIISSVFVLKAVWPAIRDGAPPSQGRTLVLATFAAQVGFAVILKLYFFAM